MNELLAHVLDEISSLKSAIYDKARSEKVRNPKKKIRGRDAGRRDADSDDDDSTDDEVEEKPARPEKVTAPDPLPTRTRKGIDFSGCFSFYSYWLLVTGYWLLVYWFGAELNRCPSFAGISILGARGHRTSTGGGFSTPPVVQCWPVRPPSPAPADPQPK